MNYDDLKQAAIAYSDRYDNEVADNMATFFRFAEARINRNIKVREMTTRAQMVLVDGQEYYPLPGDFAGMRDIEINPFDGKRKTLQYVSPEQSNIIAASGSCSFIGYTTIANQLQIVPAQSGGVIEMIYYQKLMPLDEDNPENWLSITYPDAYLSALMMEIEIFVKNPDLANIWNSRLESSLSELKENDIKERWSGTSLVTRVV